MEHLGSSNAYGNNDPNVILYHLQEQPELPMPMPMSMPTMPTMSMPMPMPTMPMPMPVPDIDMNGDNSYTRMLLQNSPVGSHGDMYSYQQPSYGWNPINDLVTHYYNEHWLTLSPPEPPIEASPLNRLPMDHIHNNHLFLNPTMDEMMLNPMGGMNAASAPPTLEFQFGGRMIPATPVELRPVGAFNGPQISAQPLLHPLTDSNTSFVIDLTNKDYLPITANNYANQIVEFQELNIQCDCQFCQTLHPTSPHNEDDESMYHVDEVDNNNNQNNVIVIDSDTDVDDNEDVDNNDDVHDDEDDDDDMNSDPGYEIYVPSVVTQGSPAVNTLAEFDRLSYEQILAIQEEIGFVENGVPDNMLEQVLKKKKFFPSASSSSSNSNASCTICWDEFKVGEDIGVLKCGHEFCYGCIEKWFMSKKTCPLCREFVL